MTTLELIARGIAEAEAAAAHPDRLHEALMHPRPPLPQCDNCSHTGPDVTPSRDVRGVAVPAQCTQCSGWCEECGEDRDNCRGYYQDPNNGGWVHRP